MANPIRVLLAVATVCLFFSTAAAAPILQYSQDGKHWKPFKAITEPHSAVDYYDLFSNSGHPQFGTEPGLSSVAMYWDRNARKLSFLSISGHDEDYVFLWGHGGSARFKFQNLPTFARLGLADCDDDELEYRNGKSRAIADFDFTMNTAGLVFSGLEKGNFSFKIKMESSNQIDTWQLAQPGHVVRELDMNKYLYLRGTIDTTVVKKPTKPGSGTAPPPVPEPSSLALITLIVALLPRSCHRRGTSEQ